MNHNSTKTNEELIKEYESYEEILEFYNNFYEKWNSKDELVNVIKNVLRDVFDENTKRVLSKKISDSIKNLIIKKENEIDIIDKKIRWTEFFIEKTEMKKNEEERKIRYDKDKEEIRRLIKEKTEMKKNEEERKIRCEKDKEEIRRLIKEKKLIENKNSLHNVAINHDRDINKVKFENFLTSDNNFNSAIKPNKEMLEYVKKN
jgi:hypothetical protein